MIKYKNNYSEEMIKNLNDTTQDSITLQEFYKKYGTDYSWDYEETLEEVIENESLNPYNEELQLKIEEAEFKKPLKVGDIIMPKKFISNGKVVDSAHRILVVSIIENDNGKVVYKGYILSSQLHKANKYGGYPNNIYIKNYGTILAGGAKSDKEAFIRVDDVVSFTKDDLDVSGFWKGEVTEEFLKFIKKCRENYLKNPNLNKTVYWEK